MKKKFNTAGICNPQLHYMADISGKIDQIMLLIEQREYFTINRPHQYGKTTIQTNLAKRINIQDGFIALRISFEEIDYEIYQSKIGFIDAFLRRLVEEFINNSYFELANLINDKISKIDSFDILSSFIGELITKAKKMSFLLLMKLTDLQTINYSSIF